ncbi:hypothetical protein BV025_004040 [Haemophilus influenzae]|uniref:hypothetical protein n=1 Tax=Haemophilus influenzae TaxID=727 RepID=UPI000D4F1FA2|nr:hypothetical protein BV025_01418 [Haemophilus influenzae]
MIPLTCSSIISLNSESLLFDFIKRNSSILDNRITFPFSADERNSSSLTVFATRLRRDPNQDALVKIYNGLEISITWLLTGNGVMFQATTLGGTILPQEEKLIADYRTLLKNLKDTFSILFDEFDKCR